MLNQRRQNINVHNVHFSLRKWRAVSVLTQWATASLAPGIAQEEQRTLALLSIQFQDVDDDRFRYTLAKQNNVAKTKECEHSSPSHCK